MEALLIENYFENNMPKMVYDLVCKKQALSIINFNELKTDFENISNPDNKKYWVSWKNILDTAEIDIENLVFKFKRQKNGDLFISEKM